MPNLPSPAHSYAHLYYYSSNKDTDLVKLVNSCTLDPRSHIGSGAIVDVISIGKIIRLPLKCGVGTISPSSWYLITFDDTKHPPCGAKHQKEGRIPSPHGA